MPDPQGTLPGDAAGQAFRSLLGTSPQADHTADAAAASPGAPPPDLEEDQPELADAAGLVPMPPLVDAARPQPDISLPDHGLPDHSLLNHSPPDHSPPASAQPVAGGLDPDATDTPETSAAAPALPPRTAPAVLPDASRAGTDGDPAGQHAVPVGPQVRAAAPLAASSSVPVAGTAESAVLMRANALPTLAPAAGLPAPKASPHAPHPAVLPFPDTVTRPTIAAPGEGDPGDRDRGEPAPGPRSAALAPGSPALPPDRPPPTAGLQLATPPASPVVADPAAPRAAEAALLLRAAEQAATTAPPTATPSQPQHAAPKKAVPTAEPGLGALALPPDIPSVVPSPSSQPPTTAPLPPPPLPPATAPALVLAVSQTGPGTVELVLTPEDLGRLQFEVTQNGDQMRIHLTVERPETLDLLRRNADQLLAEFRQAGYAGATLSFAQGGGGDRHPAGGQPTGQPTGQQPATAQDQPPPPPKTTSHPAAGGLDLRL